MRELGIIGLLLCSSTLYASTLYNFSGNFTQDDQILVFHYSVQNTGLVSVTTISFGSGGFSPVLSLFDNSGAFQFDSQGYPTNSDASLVWNSVAGVDYLIVLTQWDNLSPGPGSNFRDGFSEQGNGNFTADLPFNLPTPGASFLMPGGEQRTSFWAVTFESDEATLVATDNSVPEPSTSALWLSGAVMLAAMRRWIAQKSLA